MSDSPFQEWTLTLTLPDGREVSSVVVIDGAIIHASPQVLLRDLTYGILRALDPETTDGICLAEDVA